MLLICATRKINLAMSVCPSVCLYCQDNESRQPYELKSPNLAEKCSLCADRTLLNGFLIQIASQVCDEKIKFKLEIDILHNNF